MMALMMLALTQVAEDEKLYSMARVLEKMQKKVDEGVVEEAMGKKVSEAFARVLARARPRVEKGEAVEKIAAECIGDAAETLKASDAFKEYVRSEHFNARRLAEGGKDARTRAKGRQNMRAIGTLKKHLFPNLN